jgi:hypothetical protein
MIAFIKRDLASQALYFRFLPKHSLLERVCEGSGTKEPGLRCCIFWWIQTVSVDPWCLDNFFATKNG